MGDPREPTKSQEAAEPVSTKTFLETMPPGGGYVLVDLHKYGSRNHRGIVEQFLAFPLIELHCTSESCSGIRVFSPDLQPLPESKEEFDSRFVTYTCRNCREVQKTFALLLKLHEAPDEKSVWGILKVGETPPFGPPTPSRLTKLMGENKALFLKGRRSENQGLGIGAYAYYRRCVENQKNKILDEIARVAEKIGASPEVIADLNAAKGEVQFKKAVESITHGIPESLLVLGQNPLTLLHSALSEGLHADTDEECLYLATSIRTILAELAERLGAALKDERELAEAVSRLLKKKSEKQ